MRGDGFGGFDEDAIRAGLRAMRQADRMRLYVCLLSCVFFTFSVLVSLPNRGCEVADQSVLESERLHIVLDSCLPGDVVCACLYSELEARNWAKLTSFVASIVSL